MTNDPTRPSPVQDASNRRSWGSPYVTYVTAGFVGLVAMRA